jgi:NAD(P)-dependent dehydrogenase (short-subunit alcohol dehydrogenase family)
MKKFKDKVAVITGAASGIGFGLAQAAAERGMKLVLADIEPAALEHAAVELEKTGAQLITVVTDVSKAASMEYLETRTMEAFGGVHLVFNNAGVGGGGCIWELDTDYWEWVLGANLWGVIHGMRVFTKHLIAQGEGHIVNTASVAGLISAPGTGPYTVSKHAVVALSEVLAGELRNANSAVGVSVLCPSFVDTKIYLAERNRPLSPEKKNDPAYIEEQKLIGELAGEFFKTTMSPTEVGRQVFEAVEQERFYILTHPGVKPEIEKRMNAILNDGKPEVTGPEAFPLA